MDLLLLLLRCVLLGLLALILATPFWQKQLTTSKAKGWVLIPEGNYSYVKQHYKADLDFYASKGYEYHVFNPSFAKLDTAAVGKTKSDTISDDHLNYWQLVNQLNNTVSPNTPVALFTPNSLSHFSGEKPATSLSLNWHTYTPADSVDTWLAGAWLKANGDIRVVQVTSTPSGTIYQYNDIKNGGQAGSNYQIGVEHGTPVVSFKNSKIAVDTVTQRIAIYTDKNSLDANYLKAALDAVAQLSQRKTVIRIYNQPEAIPAGQSWLFWLSEKPIEQAIIEKNSNVFCYQGHQAFSVNSWMSNADSYTIKQGLSKIALYKTTSQSPFADAIWTDGFGNGILKKESGKTNVYRFFSRFNPAWNDLVWSEEFPKWLMQLMDTQSFNTVEHDRRALSADQIKPAYVTGTNKVITTPRTAIDLSHYLWLALMVVFFTERWLAHKNKQILANG